MGHNGPLSRMAAISFVCCSMYHGASWFNIFWNMVRLVFVAIGKLSRIIFLLYVFLILRQYILLFLCCRSLLLSWLFCAMFSFVLSVFLVTTDEVYFVNMIE